MRERFRFAARGAARRRGHSGMELPPPTTSAHAFDRADRLRWIQWGGAGVDAALFPALVECDVEPDQPTRRIRPDDGGIHARHDPRRSRRIFTANRDVASASGRGLHRLRPSRMAGTKALVVGAGSIGRAIARARCGRSGIEVEGVGRTARDGDPTSAGCTATRDLNRATRARGLGGADRAAHRTDPRHVRRGPVRGDEAHRALLQPRDAARWSTSRP